MSINAKPYFIVKPLFLFSDDELSSLKKDNTSSELQEGSLGEFDKSSYPWKLFTESTTESQEEGYLLNKSEQRRFDNLLKLVELENNKSQLQFFRPPNRPTDPSGHQENQRQNNINLTR